MFAILFRNDLFKAPIFMIRLRHTALYKFDSDFVELDTSSTVEIHLTSRLCFPKITLNINKLQAQYVFCINYSVNVYTITW